MASARPREDDELQDERAPKRFKPSEDEPHQADAVTGSPTTGENSQGQLHLYNLENLLPPSRELLGLPPISQFPPDGVMHRTSEPDVGISEYIGKGLPAIQGIIKQRFTDFLVFEVDLNHTVTRLRCIERPVVAMVTESSKEEPATPISQEEWPTSFTSTLEQFLPAEKVEALKSLYLDGPAPPLSSAAIGNGQETPSESGARPNEGSSNRNSTAKRGQGKRGKSGKDKRSTQVAADNRQVVSNPIPSKEERAQLHKLVRELFKRQLETFTDESKSSEEGGPRIIIKWAGAGDQRGHRRSAGDRGHQPFLHFTLQKTNRETSDALVHLSRLLKVEGKHLTVAGTKDKRGVTVQRVCLRRGQLTPEDVWERVNSISRKSMEEAVSERGERGVRVGDIDYRKGHLQLGMLTGNAFVITLRNVKVECPAAIDKAMEVLKSKGFINYYGMQRFGTASVPTHAVGLALLRSDWKRAVDLILQPRPGEDPSVEAARRAWNDDSDLNRAISLMPRRAVAERALLEAFQLMGSDRNLLGALSKIPRNLRTMYVHAYQSYVWNAIVSVRLKRYGSEAAVVGDLVYVDEEGKGDAETGKEKAVADLWFKKPKPKKVKALTEEDLSKFTILDVIMPLPGTDVAYPGGDLGELYKEFLRRDGLDPTNFRRKQKEYVLAGSYRNILHLPKDVSWSLLRYTDPDLPLAQTDEDFLLGLESPEIEEGGKFLALQIRLQLGTAAYATMALREITKVDTSSHVQTSLTVASEDQAFRGLSGTEVDETMTAVEDAGMDVGDDAVGE